MEQMIANLINGNLRDARDQARKRKLNHIVAYLQQNIGWSLPKSQAAAKFLKTGTGFQSYCDAV